MAFVWAITKFVNTKQQYDTKMFIARYQLINYSASSMGAECWDWRVCGCVCLSASISGTHIWTSPN